MVNRRKNGIVVSLWLMITGFIISLGPQFIFKVCETEQMQMKCFWSARAEIIIGSNLFIAGILYILMKQWQAKLALSLISLLAAVWAILIPNQLIGVCANVKMHCRSIFLPTITILSILSIVAITVNIIYLSKLKKEQECGVMHM